MDHLQTRLETMEHRTPTVERQFRWRRNLAGGLIMLIVLTWARPSSMAQNEASDGGQKGLEQHAAALEELIMAAQLPQPSRRRSEEPRSGGTRTDLPGLWLGKQKAHAPNVRACLEQAAKVMQELKLSNIRTLEGEWDVVTGNTASERAAIACLNTGKSITAIIVVAGHEARDVRDKLSKALSKKETVLID
jgi:hypothetical protein